MNIKHIGANQTELSINSVGTILFSYDTPVAAKTPEGTFKTSKKFSKTTSKHINAWASYDGEKDQEYFEELLK